MDAVPVGHDREGRRREGEGDGPWPGRDVRPDVTAGGPAPVGGRPVERGVDQVEGLFEGGLVVVDVGDDDLLGQPPRVRHVRLATHRPLEQDDRSTSIFSHTSGPNGPSSNPTETMWVCIRDYPTGGE
jgi:hypothetical protein